MKKKGKKNPPSLVRPSQSQPMHHTTSKNWGFSRMKQEEKNLNPLPTPCTSSPRVCKQTTACSRSVPRREDSAPAANVTEYFKHKQAEVLLHVFSLLVFDMCAKTPSSLVVTQDFTSKVHFSTRCCRLIAPCSLGELLLKASKKKQTFWSIKATYKQKHILKINQGLLQVLYTFKSSFHFRSCIFPQTFVSLSHWLICG